MGKSDDSGNVGFESTIASDEDAPDTDLAHARTAYSDDDDEHDEHDEQGHSAGSWISPKLQLKQLLGRGGMGSVWKAHHASLGSHVAVKLIKTSFAQRSPTALKRFTREAQLAAKLDNPHVVQIFDHGATEDGTPYIVMELLRGESLAQRLSRRGPLSVDEAKALITQTTEVIAEAHEHGVIHRDIKPDNLFLVKTRTHEVFVKVLDFGVAKHNPKELAATAVTRTGTLVGTPLYMSPEQLLGTRKVSASADLWAIGVVAYEALTGKPPFDGATVAALGVSIADGRYESVSSLRPQLDAAVDRWMDKALQREPEARFSDATAMATAFCAALDGIAFERDGGEESSDEAHSEDGERDDAATAADEQQAVPASTGAGTLDAVASTHAPEPRGRWTPGAIAAAVTLLGGAFAAAYAMQGEPTMLQDGLSAAAATAVPTVSASATPPTDASAPEVASAPEAASAAPAPSVQAKPQVVASHPAPPANPHAAPPPKPSSKPTKPAYCNDRATSFYFDENGIKKMKPECY